MTRAGFEVITATDGWTGLEYIRQRQPDVVVCAQQADGADARELKRLLEHDPATETIPFLFCTASRQRVDRLVDAESVIEQIHAALRSTSLGGVLSGSLTH
jgi:CheY-like chemotaxis protein